MLRGARVEYAAWKDTYHESGVGGVQADILELEAQTTRIAEFQPAFVPGLLQTSEYAREYLHLPCGSASFGADEAAVDQMVASRTGPGSWARNSRWRGRAVPSRTQGT